jgi:hypothetical protein
MNVLIIESCEAKIERNYKTTSIVHVRNSVVIADYLNADLISVETEIPEVINKKYDAIICMYASGYMMYNKYVDILINNKDAKIFWLINDHCVPDNILLRKFVQACDIGYDMICNNTREGYKKSHLNLLINGITLNDWIENWDVVNLNCLIFDTSFVREVKQDLFSNSKQDCIYYGTFREDRIEDMKDYNDADYGISTSKKNVVKYKQEGIVARFGDKLNWEKGKETLFNYKYSIYFEDNHTHTNYAYMANRYYECIMLDVLLFFDYRCSLVISKCGYNIDEFMIVKNGTELNDKIKIIDSDITLYNKLLDVQRSNYEIINKEKQDVLKTIENVLKRPKTPIDRSYFERLEKKRKSKPKEDSTDNTQLNLF